MDLIILTLTHGWRQEAVCYGLKMEVIRVHPVSGVVVLCFVCVTSQGTLRIEQLPLFCVNGCCCSRYR